jgi:hypothetical protein
MTDPTLTAEFPWLRRDPAQILGDARPRSIGELLGKRRLWLELYRDWLGGYNPAYLDGLAYLSGGQAREVEYAGRLGDAYPAFYRAAGQLKDWLKSHRGADPRARFRWVSGDPAGLLGEARPGDFDALRGQGQKSPWVVLYRGWLASEQPFGHAEDWLDWLLEQGSGRESWERALAPTVEAFGHDIGRLKERLRETHGNKAERVGRRVAEAAERVGLLQPGQEPGGHGAGGGAGGPGAGGGAGGPGAGGQPAGGGAGHGAGGRVAGARGVGGAGQGAGSRQPGAGGQGGAGAGQPGAGVGQSGAGVGQSGAGVGQSGAGVGQSGAGAGNAAAAVAQQVQAQAQLAAPLVAKASELGRWLGWLAPRFTIFGGYLGEESDNLHGYRQLVDGDGTRLAQVLPEVQESLGQGRDAMFAALAGLRSAVYALAWNVDLGCQNYYGGWPHQRLATVAQAVSEAGSAQLCHEAGTVLRHLAADVDQVYGVASGLLDVALQVVTAQVPGYRDAIEVWGTHEVVGARAEVSALAQLAAGLAGHEPGQEDQAHLEQACQASFGIPYLTFGQIAEYFR